MGAGVGAGLVEIVQRRRWTVQLTVSGRVVEVEAEQDMPLLWVLRDLLDLTETKYGCGVSACVAFTVRIDGQAVRSWLQPTDADIDEAITNLCRCGTYQLVRVGSNAPRPPRHEQASRARSASTNSPACLGDRRWSAGGGMAGSAAAVPPWVAGSTAGFAVIARTSWPVLRAVAAVQVDWQPRPGDALDTAAIERSLENAGRW